MATAELTDAGAGLVRCPFTILIDTAEKSPFTFDGIRARSFVDKDLRRYVVRTERRYLGIGMGDYSIDGLEGRVAIERKSVQDFQGTLLGWPSDAETAGSNGRQIDRRGRFKTELIKLSHMQFKAVVVEGTLEECLDTVKSWGTRTADENAKYLWSTYLSWSQRYRVPWYFCAGKQTAAVTAFRIMEKAWDLSRK